jgi:hypothetical protein
VQLKPRVKESKRGSVSFSPPKRGEGRDEGISHHIHERSNKYTEYR